MKYNPKSCEDEKEQRHSFDLINNNTYSHGTIEQVENIYKINKAISTKWSGCNDLYRKRDYSFGNSHRLPMTHAQHSIFKFQPYQKVKQPAFDTHNSLLTTPNNIYFMKRHHIEQYDDNYRKHRNVSDEKYMYEGKHRNVSDEKYMYEGKRRDVSGEKYMYEGKHRDVSGENLTPLALDQKKHPQYVITELQKVQLSTIRHNDNHRTLSIPLDKEEAIAAELLINLKKDGINTLSDLKIK
ncbi:hypothetical protein M153_4990001004 [Pseudoloma neurophilia]|uniref:Uncharacterized protein n=1 Tax=Pseudoloma neurophilia TaxID=146866 RepID=A0A0R0LX35_9MICR|nr:hypothetical protein M153_4990001004 [Pseudoloma neurophilia]